MALEEAIFYFEGKILKDTDLISNLNIGKNSILNLTHRPRGGAMGKGATSYSKPSFREVVNNRSILAQTIEPKPVEYIVEQSTQPLCVEMEAPIIKELYEAYTERAIICRFNGFWPKTEQLQQCIHQNWSTSIEISMCAKGFFVVYFQKPEDYRLVNKNGPWFWGRAGCFITPWKSDFDLLQAPVSITLVWVRLLNLPMHFSCYEALKEIGNTLGKLVAIDGDCLLKGMITYARMCVEVDLSAGLPEKITLKWNSKPWVEQLDYENTTFRCKSCLQTGHLQSTCPMARPSKTRRPKSRTKRWDNPVQNVNSESEEQDDGSL